MKRFVIAWRYRLTREVLDRLKRSEQRQRRQFLDLYRENS